VSGEFVYHMEDVLDIYALPFDPRYPWVCTDERPCQLLGDVLEPLPIQPGRTRRVDHEYERHGTCNLFIGFQPLRGWRHLKLTQRRTKADFAYWLKDLADIHFPDAELIRLVLDNLNTHTLAVLYEVFDPAEAHRIARKFELHFTPKHGSWLNMAELELSVLVRQCLKQRVPSIDAMQALITPWQQRRNDRNATVHWRFSTFDARTRLSSLYPSPFSW
jgi:transposase